MKTKIFLPENIFTRIFLSEIDEDAELEKHFAPAALVVKNLIEDKISLGLIAD